MKKTPALRELAGSARRVRKGASRVGAADPNETIEISIYLRRPPNAPPLPGQEYFAALPVQRKPHLTRRELGERYGATAEDLKAVTDFAASRGLKVIETSAPRRLVRVSGTAEQLASAFSVELFKYESPKENYRGHEAPIHLPAEIADIVVGVFGLDNRRMAKRAGGGGGAGAVTPRQVAHAYNFPVGGATGQTIAVLEFSGPISQGALTCGFAQSDIDGYINYLNNTTGSSLNSTNVTVVAVDQTADAPGNVPGGSASNFNIDTDADVEVALDLEVIVSVAQGADVVAYFTPSTEKGWADAISTIVADTTNDPSVLSISWGWAELEAQAAIDSDPQSWPFEWSQQAFANLTSAFQDAASIGMTVFASSGDNGSDCQEDDGNAHVLYPSTDPWITSVGGTIINSLSPLSEGTWNDNGSGGGATGGGISYLVSPQPWQSSAGVPASVNPDHHIGRGIPDVAGNASPNSGYILFLYGKSSDKLLITAPPLLAGDPLGPVGGTSAVGPLYAALIGIINASLNTRVGYLNPTLYQLGGSSVFRDINDGVSNSVTTFSGTTSPGYTSGPGWDACTGWGTLDGAALLNSLKAIYNQSLYFIVDKSTFGKDEVADVISTGGGLYPNAFWIVLEGFSITQLGSITPVLSGAFDAIAGVTIFRDPAGAEYEDPTDLYTPQRIRFPYDIIFSSAALAAFPAAGAAPLEDLLMASCSIGGSTVIGETVFQLVSGADPYFTNIDPQNNNAFYLSQDLRVFSVASGDVPLVGGPTMGSDPYGFMQNMLHFLNSTSTYTTPGPDPLNQLPGQAGYETGDSSVTPLNAANEQNYNFAVARVRLQDAAMAAAPNVRVFFRLFVAQSCDTDFQPTTTYLSQLGTAGSDSGKPVFPRPSGTGLMDPSGQSIQTIPFFVTDANGTHDYDGTVANSNIRDIQIPVNKDQVWAYYGCFLDVYNSNNQSKFPGTHHCIVAQIAYDDAPIVNANGVTLGPENSDKLAQRNLQITPSGNPSYPLTHRIPQAFDMRPSNAFDPNAGMLLNYPDELMIDWGNTPTGSVAKLYWPQISATDILALATSLYGAHSLTAADANTIQCPVTDGVTYIPIPAATGKNFAGLFAVDLPGVHVGQEFRIKVRRVASRQLAPAPVNQLQAAFSEDRRIMRNWRYVTGTFQITIPVGTDAALLPPEETTLAVLKWRLEHMSPAYRWYPVLERYIAYVSGRVNGFGGNASSVPPSLQGFPVKHGKPGGLAKHQGKVCEVVYDCFGDLTGFLLQDCCSERRFFECCEESIGELALRACRERLRVTVLTDDSRGNRICELRIGC